MPKQRIKVMTVFGTRPEAIKMAPVVLELKKHPEEIETIVVVTAQHMGNARPSLAMFPNKSRSRFGYDEG